MKSILIVNNNMKVGGVQKSLCNLLWSIAKSYDVTLYLFSKRGGYLSDLPPSVKVRECSSLFRYLGVSQGECAAQLSDRLKRGFLAMLCRVAGRPFATRLMALTQPVLPDEYDVALAYLHNGNPQSLYGGVNEFVLTKVRAKRKVAYLHCDYAHSGANCHGNNALYKRFDRIAACSDGCRRSFLQVLPDLENTCVTARNFLRPEVILAEARKSPVIYEAGVFNLLYVGRLAHEKAVDRAVRATAHARSWGLPAELHIVGDGNQRQMLQDLASQLGIHKHVHFYGEQANPYRFMLRADLLLITSYHEAAPLVIDEAKVLGLPVLTVETSSSKEMVLDARSGWVCENSQRGINECLARVLSQEGCIGRMREAMRAHATDNRLAMQQFRAVVGE